MRMLILVALYLQFAFLLYQLFKLIYSELEYHPKYGIFFIKLSSSFHFYTSSIQEFIDDKFEELYVIVIPALMSILPCNLLESLEVATRVEMMNRGYHDEEDDEDDDDDDDDDEISFLEFICPNCRYYNGEGYANKLLVCAVNPCGPVNNYCDDFEQKKIK